MSRLYDELNSAFSAFHGDVWQSLPDAKRKEILSGLDDVFNNPEKVLQVQYLDESIQRYKSRNWDVSLLVLGVFLGVSGNLLANLLDRAFVQYGLIYDLIITIIFFVVILCIVRTFHPKNPLKKYKVADELYKLTKDISPKKRDLG